MNMPSLSFFGRKGLLLIKPPKLIGRIDSPHREFGVPFVFRNRLEGQRVYDKNNEINAIFTAKHLANFLIKDLNPKFSLDVPSVSPGHPVKVQVERTDDEHIAFSVNLRKDGKMIEASVETTLADFKVMQIVFERAIPKMPEKPKAKSKSLADNFFSSS